jgi:putative inorganic carbon (HCO3(-)) transporter
MTASAAQVIGAILACGGAAAALLLRTPRARYAAMGFALLAAVGLIVGEVWGEERFEDLRSEPGVLVLALVLGGMALGATAATFVRNPAAFAIAAFAVLPLRLPVQVGDETNFLLVPLYGVIAGGWLRGAWLIATGREAELQTASSPRGDTGAARWLCVALAVSLLVYAVGVSRSEDPTNAIVTVAFFLTPFAALLVLLRDLRWHRKLVAQILAAFVIACTAFAAVALGQYVTRDLLLNTQLQEANELHLYFRVNSVFRDPNVLGRYLALAIVALGAWIAWRRPPRQALAGAAVAAILLAALTVTFSQTSFAALIAGLALLTWFRFGLRGAALAGALVVVSIGAMALVGVPSDDSIVRERDDLGEASSGRTGLVSGGINLFEKKPVSGWGSGAFAISFRREEDPTIEKPVSHFEPVTVAAEQGVTGLLPYAAVLILSGLVMVRSWPSDNAARAGVAACYAALLIHTMGYAGFLIDPITWGLLALGLALRE